MYSHLLNTLKNFPSAYESTGIAFWDDEHISKFMLDAHLAPDAEGASRKHDFIRHSVEWIASLSTPGKRLLDLGCGPGLYAEQLHDKGYCVTGVDFSKRSIKYAQYQAASNQKNIDYRYLDYLKMEFAGEFDVAVMIYCDLGVLPPDNRNVLLEKTYRALKPGGLFIVDVFSGRQYDNFSDTMTASFDDTGFWQPVPYLCLKRDKRYAGNTFLEQYIIVTECEHKTYNLWNHAFTKAELIDELNRAGFVDVKIYSNAAGLPWSQQSTTICAAGRKV